MKDVTSGIANGDFKKASLNAGVMGMAYAAGAGGASKISSASGAKAAMMTGATMSSVGGQTLKNSGAAQK